MYQLVKRESSQGHKKMATAGKGWQLVKPHVKLISFPARSGVIPKWTGQNVATAASSSTPQLTLKSTTPSHYAGDSLPAPPWPQVGALPRGAGIPHAELPAKYRRKTLTDAEIDAILSGGAP